MTGKELKKPLASFLEDGGGWKKKRASAPNAFVLKLPEYKGSPQRLSAGINPVDSSGNPTKKRGLLAGSPGELEKFKELISAEGSRRPMETIREVNPEKAEKTSLKEWKDRRARRENIR